MSRSHSSLHAPGRRRTARAAVAGLTPAVALLVALVGCAPTGTQSSAQVSEPYPGRSAAEILALAQQAAAEASSVTLTGTSATSGAGSTPIAFTVWISDTAGRRTVLTAGGGELELRELAGAAYVRADEAFLTSTAAAGRAYAGLLGGGWLKLSPQQIQTLGGAAANVSGAVAGDATAAVLPLAKGLQLTRVAGAGASPGSATAGIGYRAEASTPSSPSTERGAEVIPGLGAGSLPAAGTVYVAIEGTPYPVQVIGADGSTLTFGAWNQPLTLAEPPAAEVRTIADLGMGGLGLDDLAGLGDLGGDASALDELAAQMPG